MKPKVIDLFAGVGGLSLGFENSGFAVVLANEYDPSIAAAYEKNHKGTKMICGDITSLDLQKTFYLQYSNGTVTIAAPNSEKIEDYQKRVDTLLRLNATKVIGLEDLDADTEGIALDDLEESRINSGTNILLYGVPGSGKSWTIEHEYCKVDSYVERLVFHPDYTYSDFVGQILPDVDDEGLVTYKFTPGPFTTIMREAYRNPTQEYILIIEEINRGNAPAIFGEVFQLLDRTLEPKKDHEVVYPAGTSEYGITNRYMATVIYGDGGHKVRIPSNLSVIGTMNTSDQNVFTLDTAFQRRWNMRLIENTFENVRPSLANAKILDTNVTWETFCTTVNKLVVGNRAKMASAEDKRLGVYFVHESDLEFDDRAISPDNDLRGEYNVLLKAERDGNLTPEQKGRLYDIREALKKIRKFPEKVIKYLWDDAFKFNPEALFDTDNMESLEQVIRTFVYVKLPSSFYIATPVGRYSPDWAIAFYKGTVKHIYFVAETKGSMSSMQLRLIEDAKIHCAREHFKAISNGNVVYDAVDSWQSLLERVMK